MKLPRDISGRELAALLRRFGYAQTRQTGSHIRLSSTVRDRPHHISIPAHASLKVGTLNSILNSVAEYLGMSRGELCRELFGR